MRKNVLALGIFLLFVGLLIVSLYTVVVKPEPTLKWRTVIDIRGQPKGSLTVEGNLTQGDQFRVSFLAVPPGPSFPLEAGVTINLTDPQGRVEFFDIPLDLKGGGLVAQSPLPEGTANHTGAYKVYAEAQIALLTYLALQRRALTEVEPQYPYRGFFPVGIAVLLGGVSAFLFGIKSTKQRERARKKH